LTLRPIAPVSFALHKEVLTNLNSAAWMVLVCKGGSNIALELARLDKPLLVVEADPDQAEELHRQLAEQTISGLTVYCELLGAEVGTTCWHYYNDSRQNGTTGLEALQSHYPNLRLKSQETRRLQRLDEILTTWEKLGKSTGNGPLEGAGAFLAYGVEALPLLQGGGSWLERFSQLVVPAPVMETGCEIEAWSALLKGNSLRHSAHVSQSDWGSNWILLKQDRERLLEERLQLLVDQISAVEAVRDDLARNQQALTTQRDGLSQQNHVLLAQRDALQAERDELSNKQLELTTQRDGLSQQNDVLLAQRDALQAERDEFSNKHLELTTQRDGLSQQNHVLLAQRDALQAERDELSNKHLEFTAERDSLTKEFEILISQRDGFATNKQELTIENHDLLEERNSLKSRLERLTEVLQTSNKQLSDFKSIYSSLIIAYQDSRHDK